MRGRPTLLAAAAGLAAVAATPASSTVVPTPIGPGAPYHPGPRGPLLAADRAPGFACSRAAGSRFGVHLELFARGLVVLVPAGIGIAPPLRPTGTMKVSGSCSSAARTREPTGVIEVVPGAAITLGGFFTVWGEPLSSRRLAGFQAIGRERVRAWVDGRPWQGNPRSIPLLRHMEIVLELGRFVPPHVSYRFEKGL